MKTEIIIQSEKVKGLVRKVEFSSSEFESLKEFILCELQDEIDKLKIDEDKLLAYINGKGKKIRF